MKRKALIGLVIISVLGLGVVQYRLLFLGMKLEKQRFDQRVRIALLEVQELIDKDTTLIEDLNKWVGLYPPKNADLENEELQSIEADLKQKLNQSLEKKGVNTKFSFAISDKFGTEIYLKSADFEGKDLQFDDYNVLLENNLVALCHCQRVLHLDISNLFGFLLGQLSYLALPSLGFLLILSFCIWYFNEILMREKQLNTIKNDFINNLTHELKTPVFSIKLSSRIAKEYLEKGSIEKTKEFLTLIDKENERVKIHVDKVLELASLESGKYQLEKSPYDLNLLIKEVLERFKIKIESHKGILHEYLNATSQKIAVDATHFKNVVQNLLENALKYSGNLIEIEVETKTLKNEFQLIIKDRGIGIAPEHQKRVFEKFYRVPKGNLHEVKGFGLGLNYVQKIVEAHKGAIELESKQGEGSTFKISIPF